MTIQSHFRPAYGSTQAISPGASSANVAIGLNNATIRVKNTGATNTMFFRTGNSVNGTVVATSADMPVGPGEAVYVFKDPTHDRLAHISASGTTAFITAGDGGSGAGN